MDWLKRGESEPIKMDDLGISMHCFLRQTRENRPAETSHRYFCPTLLTWSLSEFPTNPLNIRIHENPTKYRHQARLAAATVANFHPNLVLFFFPDTDSTNPCWSIDLNSTFDGYA